MNCHSFVEIRGCGGKKAARQSKKSRAKNEQTPCRARTVSHGFPPRGGNDNGHWPNEDGRAPLSQCDAMTAHHSAPYQKDLVSWHPLGHHDCDDRRCYVDQRATVMNRTTASALYPSLTSRVGDRESAANCQQHVPLPSPNLPKATTLRHLLRTERPLKSDAIE